MCEIGEIYCGVSCNKFCLPRHSTFTRSCRGEQGNVIVTHVYIFTAHYVLFLHHAISRSGTTRSFY